MSQDQVSLYNQALATVGDKNTVASLTEVSRAAALCKLHYPPARRAVFSAFHWPSLRAVARLAPQAIRGANENWQDADPWPGFAYSFQLPNLCVAPRHLHDFSRFQLGRSQGIFALFANTSAPILHYTEDVESPGQWEAALYDCVMYSLAARINFAANGKANVTQKLEDQVRAMIALAATDAANQDEVSYDEIPTTWAGTGFSPPAGHSKYIYPTSSYRVGGIQE